MNGDSRSSHISILKKTFAPIAISLSLTQSGMSNVNAADLLPLETCINAVKTELTDRPSLNRIAKDIDSENWEDLKIFTREYDAGFRGSVLKSAWKQLDGEKKQLGIQYSNSFTFDLIGLNKASRKADKLEAARYLAEVEKDLINFYGILK